MTLLKKVLKEIEQEQAIIFCSRKATTTKIKENLEKDFGKADLFMGDMGSSAREKVLDDFKSGKMGILLQPMQQRKV